MMASWRDWSLVVHVHAKKLLFVVDIRLVPVQFSQQQVRRSVAHP